MISLLRLFRVLKMASKNLSQARLRAGLTTLGIIFGVCSVVAMLAVGEGASQEIQEQLQRLGSRNILIKSLKLPEEQLSGGQRRGGRVASYGITYDDYKRFSLYIPGIESATPMKRVRYDVSYGERKQETYIVPTAPWFSEVTNRRMIRGRFLCSTDMDRGSPVCVLGARLARNLFPGIDPLGKRMLVGSSLYQVIGILGDVITRDDHTIDPLWYEGENEEVYIPLSAYIQREGDLFVKWGSGSSTYEKVELHEVILTLKTQDDVLPGAAALRDILGRYHKRQDYEIVVPLQLIQQAQETRRLFNIVLGSLAAISLLVGGIGIMNIMLATVSERTREIGIRRALGARRRDIVLQFLVETLVLTLLGGLIGMLLGALVPQLVTLLTKVRTVLTFQAFAVAFTVSVAVGLIFGIYPARRAARMDPIEALRHE